jgi:hypothetical protein
VRFGGGGRAGQARMQDCREDCTVIETSARWAAGGRALLAGLGLGFPILPVGRTASRLAPGDPKVTAFQ